MYPAGAASTHSKPQMPLSHFWGNNFWILKAINLNRGRWIHVFNKLSSLKKLLKQYSTGKRDHNGGLTSKLKKLNFGGIKMWRDKLLACDIELKSNTRPAYEAIYSQPQVITNESSGSKGSFQQYFVNKPNPELKSFIIQKYIERPFLIHGRKFDIRVWVLVSHTGKCYFFKEGYLRTSAAPFCLDASTPDDPSVHLTNNAVQKHAEGYGRFEEANQLSFGQFQDYLSDSGSQFDFFRDCLPQMKAVARHTLLAARRKLASTEGRLGFELFGFDFMLDADFNTWLIEVNTNPCIEESSEMLRHYLRRMLDDMMKLELDPIFPKPSKPLNPSSKPKLLKPKSLRRKDNSYYPINNHMQ